MGIGSAADPWGSHFVANPVVFVMLGRVSHSRYRDLADRLLADLNFERVVRVLAVALGLALLFQSWRYEAFQNLADNGDHRLWQTFPVLVLLVPALFFATRNSWVDNFIGLFSYPNDQYHLLACYAASGVFGIPCTVLTTSIGRRGDELGSRHAGRASTRGLAVPAASAMVAQR
jgi:hypothetical protein